MVFDGKQDKRQKSDDALISRLYQQIGQLKVERDFLAERSRSMSRERRREMVDREHPVLSTLRQCALMGISRSSVYYRPRAPSQKDLALMKQIDQQYLATPFYGSRRMKVWLDRQGHRVNRKRIQRLMRAMGLQAIYRRPRTSQPGLGHKVHPYLLGGMEFNPAQPGVGSGYHLRPDGPGLPLPGGHHGFGTAATWWLGGCPTPWTLISAWRPWRRRWARESPRCSTPTKEASSPARALPGS